ncbi:MAG: flagellar basal body P-ring formation chaperone FlgA [Planctomycetota bacterium]|nr:flagellar basal body P-ring formation chaperone FlgA [Planctomycetota bacterium]
MTLHASIFALLVLAGGASAGVAAPEPARTVSLGLREPLTLRSTARIVPPASGPAAVRLRDVLAPGVSIEPSLADTILIADLAREAGPSGQVSISPDDLRRRLGDLGLRTRFEQTPIQGPVCTVLLVRAAPAQALAAKPAAHAPAPTADTIAPGTVRAAVAERLVMLAGLPATRVRLTFDSKDQALLDLPVAGRVVDVRAAGESIDVPLSVRVYEGDRIVATDTITVKTESQREVAVLARDVRRGQVISAQDIQTERRWVSAVLKPVDAREAVGLSVRAKRDKGAVLTRADVEPPVVVRKGDVIEVNSLSGGIVIRSRGRALTDGRAGETIELSAPEDRRRRFFARLDASGRAVIADAPQPRTQQESAQ